MPRLITLGGLSVQNGAVVNGVANPRSRLAILAVLAIAGERGIRREKLAALFWPESDEDRARNALRQALFTLKRDIGAGDITLGTADLRLNPEVLSADVTEFDDATRSGRFDDAAQLYRGTFLDGVYLKESPEFERWAEEQRSRLSAEYGRALEKAAASAGERGDFQGAAQWWEQRATHDPLSGRVAKLYMEALFAAGDRERAIRHAAVHAQLVRQELDTEPDPDVLRAADQLREATAYPALGESLEPNGRRETLASHETSLAPRPDTVGAAIGVTSSVTAKPRNRARPALLAALVLLAAASAAFVLKGAVTNGPPVQPGLVAVAPVENLTGGSELDAVADAATSSVVEVVTQSAVAGVLDLRTLLPAKSRDVDRDIADLAHRSSAEFLVRGFIERRRDSLVVRAQVSVARSGRIQLQLPPMTVPWTARDRIPHELRELVGGEVVALGDTVFPLWRTGRSRPPRFSAYHEFRQGLDALVHQTEKLAIQHFVKAMALDPDFVQAKLWYLEQAVSADSETVRMDSVRAALEARRESFFAYDKVATDRQLAFLDGRLEDVYTAARQMVAIAPDVPDSRIALAQASMGTQRFREAIEMLHSVRVAPAWLKDLNQRRSWDLHAHRLLGDTSGIRELREARAGAAPDDGTLCRQGILMLASLGREAEVDSLVTACDGLMGTPADQYLQVAGQSYRVNGHGNEAERAFRKAFAMRSDLVAREVRPRIGLARLHVEFGEWRAAYDIFRQVPEPDANRLELAVAAAHVGDVSTAEQALGWFSMRKRHQERAMILLALGKRDSALAALQAAVNAGVSPTWYAWHIRPDLDPLRSDPRFQQLIRPVR